MDFSGDMLVPRRVCVYAKSYWDNWFLAVIKRPTVFFCSAHQKAAGPNASPEGWGYGPMGRGSLMSQGCLKHLLLPTFPPGTCPQIWKMQTKDLRKLKVCIWDKPSLHWKGEYVVPLYVFFIKCFVGIEKSMDVHIPICNPQKSVVTPSVHSRCVPHQHPASQSLVLQGAKSLNIYSVRFCK